MKTSIDKPGPTGLSLYRPFSAFARTPATLYTAAVNADLPAGSAGLSEVPAQ